MNRYGSTRLCHVAPLIPRKTSIQRLCVQSVIALALATATSQASSAQLRGPDVLGERPIKPNPTAEVRQVCHELDRRDFSQLIHATCYSEVNQAVVVLVSGNADGFSGEKVGSLIVGELEKNYIPAAAFLENPQRNKVSIVYLLNGDAYGPYSGHNWLEGVKVLQRHAPQAWFKASG